MNLRRATADDVTAIAHVSRASRFAAMPWLPDLHTPDEDRAFFASEVETSHCVVAEVEGRIVGFACERDGWLNHLYVLEEFTGQSIGSALLESVPAATQLWAFQRNTRAREFYRQRGWVEVELTDGSGNEEKEPDVRLERHSASA
jgi:GNAT superfamily N-acetyltransferase